MAWLSVGIANDDLCDKLVQHGVLRDNNIETAFRIVDRGDFVHDEDRLLAYLDRPYKRGPLHLSAPHMYVTVLEALNLQPGQAFLNVGSGSGYLNCLASFLLGPSGISHGVEIQPTLVVHSRKCIADWQAKCEAANHNMLFEDNENDGNSSSRKKSATNISVSEGNCFDIDIAFSKNTCLYDRIYIGAACPDQKKDFFYSLLADNGTIVIPIMEKNEMICVKKLGGKVFSQKHVSHVHFAPLLEVPMNASFYARSSENAENVSPDVASAQEDISSSGDGEIIFHTSIPLFQHTPNVASGSVSSNNSIRNSRSPSKVKLPPLVWEPIKTRHLQFPQSFRSVVKLILLSCRDVPIQEGMVTKGQRKTYAASICGRLPVVIWFQILSFASRDWFSPSKSAVELLQIELMAERRLRTLAEEKLALAMGGKRAAERERDILRVVVARLGQYHHTSNALSTFISVEEEEEDEEEVEEDEENVDAMDEEHADGEEEEEEEGVEDDFHDIHSVVQEDDDAFHEVVLDPEEDEASIELPTHVTEVEMIGEGSDDRNSILLDDHQDEDDEDITDHDDRDALLVVDLSCISDHEDIDSESQFGLEEKSIDLEPVEEFPSVSLPTTDDKPCVVDGNFKNDRMESEASTSSRDSAGSFDSTTTCESSASNDSHVFHLEDDTGEASKPTNIIIQCMGSSNDVDNGMHSTVYHSHEKRNLTRSSRLSPSSLSSSLDSNSND